MSYPFERLALRRFRGLQDLEFSGLGRFNLLVGENNSGKTSVLEALALCSKPFDLETWVATARRRDLPLSPRPHPARQLRWLFPQRPDLARGAPYTGHLSLDASGSFEFREIKAQLEEMRALVVTPDGELPGKYVATGDVVAGARLDVQVELADTAPRKRLTHSFTILERGESRVPTIEEAPELHARFITPHAHWTASLESLFSEAAREGHRDAAVELIKSLGIGVGHAEILSDENVPVLYLEDTKAGSLPLSAFGDGVRRTLLLALTIPLVSKGVLLIDELETAIHVSMLGKVFRWLLDACHEHDVQVFATTHSLEAIDAILDADTTPQEDVVAFRLERVQEQMKAKRFGEEVLKHLRRELGLDLR